MGENVVLAIFIALPAAFGAALVLFARHLRTKQQKTGMLHVIAGNCLLLLFLLSLIPVFGEIYCRFVRDTTDSLNYTKASVRWFDRHWHENTFGCRDTIDYLTEIPAGKRRITFVGDSFTAAQGVNNVDDRFVNLIRQANPDWQVEALAKAGADTGDEIALLRAVVERNFHLDHVVLVYCLNDVSDMLHDWDDARKALSESVARMGWLQQNSYFVDLLAHRLQARRNLFMKKYFDVVRSGYEGEMWEKQKQRLRAFRILVTSNGGHLSVVTFPFFQSLGPNYEYAPLHRKLDDFWRELSVPHLDLLEVYSNFPPSKLIVNRFDAHPNEFAHSLAAEAIEKFLLPKVAETPLPALRTVNPTQKIRLEQTPARKN